MIQRIQTVYLLIVAVLLAIMLSRPVFTVDIVSPVQGTETIKMMPFGIKSVSSEAEIYVTRTSYVGAMIVLCLLLTAVIIFLYRFRWVQMRLCVILIVLLFGLQVFTGYYLYKAYEFVAGVRALPTGQSTLPVSYSVTDVFPVVCAILVYLALRGILKDELLVKSLNRIR